MGHLGACAQPYGADARVEMLTAAEPLAAMLRTCMYESKNGTSMCNAQSDTRRLHEFPITLHKEDYS